MARPDILRIFTYNIKIIKVMQIKDLKIGTIFQIEGLDMNGNTVQCDATLRSYQGMNKYVVESDGITILYDGDQKIL